MSLHISDVMHEFSHPGVREDVLQVMLQIADSPQMYEGDVSHLRLEVNGEGEVTASDIQCPAEVEILNPELYLFTVDNPDTHLEIDMTVERGRGYLPANDRTNRLPIGELPVDAIFSPIKRVNWNVGSALYGQSTNYDKLELEIWTDGTIQPQAALILASKILIEHLRYISGITEEVLPDTIVTEQHSTHVTSETAETPIESLDSVGQSLQFIKADRCCNRRRCA